MCGVVGVFGRGSTQADDAFTTLLFVDMVRGTDSTGVAFVNNSSGKVSIEKCAGLPPELAIYTDFEKKIRQNNVCIIGHNRAATRGKINDKNAHPFQHGRITGCHNGTLLGKWRLPDHGEFDTDSEALINAINKLGIEEAYKIVDGPATIVWWDSEEKTLNFVTNGQRPLVFAVTKDQQNMYWASEAWMLNAIKERHKLEFKDGIKKPKDHILFSWSWEKGKVDFNNKKLTEFKNNTTYVYHHNSSYTGHNHWYSKGSQATPAQQTLVIPTAKDVEKFVNNKEESNKKDRLVASSNSNGITASRFIEALRQVFSKERFDQQFPNCCFCGDSLDFWDKDVEVFDEHAACCPSCSAVSKEYSIRPPNAVVG